MLCDDIVCACVSCKYKLTNNTLTSKYKLANNTLTSKYKLTNNTLTSKYKLANNTLTSKYKYRLDDGSRQLRDLECRGNLCIDAEREARVRLFRLPRRSKFRS